jgi:hypothetical protein
VDVRGIDAYIKQRDRDDMLGIRRQLWGLVVLDTFNEMVYWSIGSVGLLVILEIIWWVGIGSFYKLAKIRHTALEEEWVGR